MTRFHRRRADTRNTAELMDQQKNLLLAIVLSAGIYAAFLYLFPHNNPPPEAPSQQTTQSAPQAGAPAAPGMVAPSTVAAATTAPRETVLAATPRVKIDTPRLAGSINLVGGRVDDLTLVNYRETPDPDSAEIVLLAPDGTAHPYFAEFGWVAGDATVKVPGPETRWSSNGGALTPDHPVELSWDNGAGLTFKRQFAVDRDYMFSVTQQVTNGTAQKLSLYPYAFVARKGEVPVSGTYLLHEGPIGVFNGTLQDGYKYDSLTAGKPVSFDSTGGWTGITDKYWLTALIPNQKEAVTANFRHSLQDHTDLYQVDYRGSEHAVEPGATVTATDDFFAGAKEVALLDRYESELGIPRFDRAIDFGWFYFLTKPIFLTLDFFYKLIGNFGLAIMLLTFTIKLIFFPLANKSYSAMSKMKQLQPEMQKLRERFGDDKTKLNQEMMALYKRVGANPMAGCLPIVIQIPVFFSLYKVLYVTIEMRHAPFYGWIHDLSAPDPTSFVNLFGLLPYATPEISFLHIGAWPILMGITMFLQQKLNPQPPDPVQAKMFMALPFVFTYMLSQFASGLVIYWAWNNLLSICQQWVIMRRAGITRAKPPAKPVKTT
jgi:YidC/Oxa1 family membrane protein insertase